MASTSDLSTVARRLEGKVALITGGASGIGEYTAKLFAEHGAKVAIADVQEDLGDSVTKSIGPSDSIFIKCDVTNEDDVKNAVNTTVSTFGKLDIMFNNAGISDPHKPRIIDNELSDFERVLKINIAGVFLGSKHAASVMVPARSGCIISTASVSSILGNVGSHAYCASKHAVLGLTRNLAVELGQFGIRVNCLSPYAIATPLATKFVGLSGAELEEATRSIGTLKGATLRMEDVAKAALYLASDDAKYINGLNLVVDGGFSVHNGVFNVFQYPDEN